MTEAMRLNIEDSVERMVFLNNQMKGAQNFAPFKLLPRGYSVLIDDWDAFQEIRSIYGLTDMEIQDKRNDEIPSMRYTIDVKGLNFSYIALKGDDGYVDE